MPGASAGVAFVDVKPDWAGFNRSLSSQTGTLTRQFSGLGMGLGKALTGAATKGVKVGAVGIAAGLVYSTKKAIDFEAQLSSLGAVADASAAQMETLRKAALKAGADTKFSALEAAKAQTELAKGGLSTAQILSGGLNSALALAAAGELELADAASTVVRAMKLFKIPGRESIKVADALSTAANSTTADVSDFALALTQAGSAAKTVGLSFPETISALETLAEVGIKGSDAGTSLKTMLVQLASPSSDKAVEMAKKLGINIFDSTGKIKPLVEVSKELQDGLGGLTEQQRIQAATTLVGQDGFRALLALYDAGPEKVAKLQKELGKQGSAAEVARKKQDNLKGSLEQLGGSFETLGINVGSLLTPALRTAADELTEFTNDVSKIVSDDKLDLGEKLSKVLDVAKADAEPWVDKLEASVIRADIPGRIADVLQGGTDRIAGGIDGGSFADKLIGQADAADLPERLGGLVSEAAPVIAEAAGKIAVAAAGAFARSFIAADAWGKLVLGGWLLTKMGGLGAFAALGRRAGGAMATGAATSAVGGAGGTVARGAGVAGSTGVGAILGGPIGAAIAAAISAAVLGGAMNKQSRQGTAKATASAFTERLPQIAAQDPKAFEDVSRALDIQSGKIKFNREEYDRLRGTLERLDISMGDSREEIEAVQDAFGDIRGTLSSVNDAISRMADGATGSIRSLRTNVRLNTRLIKNALGDDTEAGRQALARNFAAAVENIRTSMEQGKIATGEGTAEIERLMVKSLAQFGFSKEQALNIARTGDDQGNKGREGGALRKQRGGPITGGLPSGDSIPAVLERGEYVVNREAVKKVGVGMLDRLNFGIAARFQEGGQVGGFPDAMGALPGLDALAFVLNKLFSLRVTSGLRPGAITTSGNPSDHGWGGAIDVSNGVTTPQMDAAHGWLGRVMGPAIKQMLYRTMVGGNHFDHIHVALQRAFAASAAKVMTLAGGEVPTIPRMLVSGPDSSLKSLVQGTLDTTRGGAQGALKNAIGFQSGGLVPALMAAGGASPAGVNLGKALDRIRTGRTPKLRAGATKKLVDSIAGIGFGGPAAILSRLEGDADLFSEYADRAGRLTDSEAIQDALQAELTRRQETNPVPSPLFPPDAQQGIVETLLGRVGGVTQLGWLTKQLGALFDWRNVIADTGPIVANLKADADALLADAQEELVEVLAQIEKAEREIRKTERERDKVAKHREHVQNQIEKEMDKPAKKRDQGKLSRLAADAAASRAEHIALNAKLASLRSERDTHVNVRESLTEDGGVIDTLTTKSEDLGKGSESLAENLIRVQGLGGPAGRLGTLPPHGALGGLLFDVGDSIKNLTDNPPRIDATVPAQSQNQQVRADLLEGLLREANQRTAVSEATFDVLSAFPKFGGSFATGGTVEGPLGAPRTIIAHGGERVLTADEAQGGGVQWVVNVAPGMEWLRQFISVEQRRADRRTALTAGRGLPGVGGGGIR